MRPGPLEDPRSRRELPGGGGDKRPLAPGGDARPLRPTEVRTPPPLPPPLAACCWGGCGVMLRRFAGTSMRLTAMPSRAAKAPTAATTAAGDGGAPDAAPGDPPGAPLPGEGSLLAGADPPRAAAPADARPAAT